MDAIRIDELTYDRDADDLDGFRAGMARLGPRLGAEQTGVTI